MERNEAENEAAEPVAPPGEGPRRRVHIGLAALDRMLQREPEELLLQITSRVSANCVQLDSIFIDKQTTVQKLR